MRKYLLLLVSLLLLNSRPARACDICGCFMGITPYDNQSGFMLLHRYRIFNGYQALGQAHALFPGGASWLRPSGALNADDGYRHAHLGDPTDFEAFRTLELRGRYFLTRRLELNAFVPYVLNTEQANGKQLNLSGLGDITVLAGFHAIRQIETAGLQSRLVLGGGLKLPTGAYRRANAAGLRYAMLSQAGTGTTDAVFYANYVGSFRGFGLSLTPSYRRSLADNTLQNRLAPSFTTFANLFYRLPLGPNWQVYPSAQFYYEQTDGEMLDGELTHEHALNDALVGPGLDIYYKNFSLNTSVQLPLFTATTDHPASAGRLVLAVGYSFKQTKYLFGK